MEQQTPCFSNEQMPFVSIEPSTPHDSNRQTPRVSIERTPHVTNQETPSLRKNITPPPDSVSTQKSTISTLPFVTVDAKKRQDTIKKLSVKKVYLFSSMSSSEDLPHTSVTTAIPGGSTYETYVRRRSSYERCRKMDPTIRIFNAMPKGLEYFLRFGPPKMVEMREEVMRVNIKEELLAKSINISLMVQERSSSLIRKKEALVGDMKRFEVFIEDNDRKKHKAEQTADTAQTRKAAAVSHLTKLRQEYQSDSQRLMKIKSKVDRLQPMADFIGRICERGSFPSADYAISRHSSLVHSFKDLKRKQVLNLTVRAEELEEEQKSVNNDYHNRMLILTDQLRKKEKRLVQAKSDIKAMTAPAEHAIILQKENMRKQHLIERSVLNMGRALQDFRQYTMRRVEPCMESGNVVDVLEAIGEIINDYNVMLRPLKIRTSKSSKSDVRFHSKVKS